MGRRLGGASRDRCSYCKSCDHIWCAVFVLNKENTENRENRENREKVKKCTDWEAPRRRLSRPVLALVGEVTIYGVRFSVESREGREGREDSKW